MGSDSLGTPEADGFGLNPCSAMHQEPSPPNPEAQEERTILELVA